MTVGSRRRQFGAVPIRGVAAFASRRILLAIPMILVVTLAGFLLVELMPGDAASRLEMNPELSPQTIAAFRAQFGLEQPVWTRYVRWLWSVLSRGDFGISFETGLPAVSALCGGGRLGWTAIVSSSTLLVIWIIAIPLGIACALRPRGLVDRLAGALALVGLSVPGFLIGLVLLFLLVVVFRVGEHGLGVGGLLDAEHLYGPWTWSRLGNLVWHLWPVWLVSGLGALAGWVRQLRGNLLDALGRPFILAARAHGIDERAVVRHALRHAMNPILSMMGLSLPYVISGSLISAAVFNLPTVERAFWSAIQGHDAYVVLAGLLFFSASLALGNLAADVLLVVLDPRVRVGS
jgi:peptide/nickel transport system permease protein